MSTKGIIEMGSRVVAAKEHVSCELDNEIVILSLRTGEYFGLNPVAASIWEMIQAPQNVTAIRDSLIREYEGITAEDCAAEVLELLSQMAELELVEVVPPQSD